MQKKSAAILLLSDRQRFFFMRKDGQPWDDGTPGWPQGDWAYRWSCAGGLVDPGEQPLEALRREMREEINHAETALQIAYHANLQHWRDFWVGNFRYSVFSLIVSVEEFSRWEAGISKNGLSEGFPAFETLPFTRLLLGLEGDWVPFLEEVRPIVQCFLEEVIESY